MKLINIYDLNSQNKILIEDEMSCCRCVRRCVQDLGLFCELRATVELGSPQCALERIGSMSCDIHWRASFEKNCFFRVGFDQQGFI